MIDATLPCSTPRAPRLPVWKALIRRVRARIAEMQAERRLQRLPDHLLRDVGLSRHDIETFGGVRDVETALEIRDRRGPR